MNDDLPFSDEPLPEPDVEMIEAVYGKGRNRLEEDYGVEAAKPRVVIMTPVCPIHPEYQAKRRPSSCCPYCKDIWTYAEAERRVSGGA